MNTLAVWLGKTRPFLDKGDPMSDTGAGQIVNAIAAEGVGGATPSSFL